MAFATVQVFEHTTIRVGEDLRCPGGGTRTLSARHHQALADFADATLDRYFACGRHTVRFGSYVGFLQVGDLGIEVLPKADRNESGGHNRWHRALVSMLRTVGDLGLEAPDEARLRTDPGRLFDLFVGRFLDECERLTHEGLAKSYRTVEENRSTFRGRLLVAQHVRENFVNAARFYVASPIYDYASLPNLALREALRVVEGLPIAGFLTARAKCLGSAFPELPRWRPTLEQLDRVRLTRNTARYAHALRLARLILFHLSPHIARGELPLLALLFDMNTLWERYVATLARRLRLPGIDVRAQDSRPFWRAPGSGRPLRPDLVLRSEAGVRLLVDTKWKVPRDDRPSSADLKQMFCYHEIFDCTRSMLLYPSTASTSEIRTKGRFVDRDHQCELGFLAIDGPPAEELRRLFGSVAEG